MGTICYLTFLLLLIQSLQYVDCYLNVSFKYLPLTVEMKDKINLYCSIQNKHPISSDSFSFQVLGYIISRRAQNHWETIAELYKSQPDKVFVTDSRITAATGRLISETYINVAWLTTETAWSVKYRCDVIVKENNSEGQIRVFFSKLGSELNSFKKRNENDTEKENKTIRDVFLPPHKNAVNNLSTRLKTDINEGSLRGITEGPVYRKIKLVKRSLETETALNPGIKSLDKDYNEMSGILTSMRSRLHSYTKNMNDTIYILAMLHKESMNKVQQVISYVNFQNENHKFQLKNFSDELTKAMTHVYNDELKKTIADVLAPIRWPGGNYSLLKPNTGCPSRENALTTWQEGFILFHTESSESSNGLVNYDSYSSNSHLVVPIKSRQNNNNFITLHFCSSTKLYNEELEWPKGSYCINTLGNCMNGFEEGKIGFDLEDTDFQGNFSGMAPWNEIEYELIFCCRSDGSPLNPVTLPRFSPFYLYRYQGRCQNVTGMTFNEEFIYFDTENNGNGDSRSAPYPDGAIKNINITLCYYEAD